jgi:hypothetical protein
MTKPGIDADGIADTEADHFMRWAAPLFAPNQDGLYFRLLKGCLRRTAAPFAMLLRLGWGSRSPRHTGDPCSKRPPRLGGLFSFIHRRAKKDSRLEPDLAQPIFKFSADSLPLFGTTS